MKICYTSSVGLSNASTFTELSLHSTLKIAPLICIQFCRETKAKEEISP